MSRRQGGYVAIATAGRAPGTSGRRRGRAASPWAVIRDDGGTMTTQTSAQTGDQSVSGRAGEVKDRAAEVGGTVQEKTSEVAGTATSRATDVASTAKDQALDVAQEAQRQARDLFGEFRGQVQQQTQQQRDRLVELPREFEDELQNMVQAGGGSRTAREVLRPGAHPVRGGRSY